MNNARRSTRAAGALLAALLMGTGLAACTEPEQPKETPTAWSPQDAENTSGKDGEKAQDPQYKVVPGSKWTVKLPEGGKSAMVDPATWPDAKEMLTGEQIQGILPTLSLQRPEFCAFGTYNVASGGQTPKNAQCSYDLGDGNRLRITLRGIGADSEVTKMWNDVRQQFQGQNASDDSFYKDGTYGARKVLLRRDGLGSFVVSDGEVAAWVDVDFPDDDFIVNDDNPATFEAIKTKAFPTMVETFVTFLPRSH